MWQLNIFSCRTFYDSVFTFFSHSVIVSINWPFISTLEDNDKIHTELELWMRRSSAQIDRVDDNWQMLILRCNLKPYFHIFHHKHTLHSPILMLSIWLAGWLAGCVAIIQVIIKHAHAIFEIQVNIACVSCARSRMFLIWICNLEGVSPWIERAIQPSSHPANQSACSRLPSWCYSTAAVSHEEAMAWNYWTFTLSDVSQDVENLQSIKSRSVASRVCLMNKGLLFSSHPFRQLQHLPGTFW